MTDTSTTTVPSIVRQVDVAAPIDACFKVFVDGFDTWWPPEHHLGDRTIAGFYVEPRVGGRCYDVDTEGGECHWGSVLAIDPPTRLVLAWHIQSDWTIDLDPARQSEVEITFAAIDPSHTTVRLEHRHLARHGADAEGLKSGIEGPGGWTILLARFADVAEGRPPRRLDLPG